jgi:ABC-type multidrug transport system ATPase subunit
VEEVIKLLDMQDFADAVVGVPGDGLNVERGKRLTIEVELAAKPDLLLFLDEPTSGLYVVVFSFSPFQYHRGLLCWSFFGCDT